MNVMVYHASATDGCLYKRDELHKNQPDTHGSICDVNPAQSKIRNSFILINPSAWDTIKIDFTAGGAA